MSTQYHAEGGRWLAHGRQSASMTAPPPPPPPPDPVWPPALFSYRPDAATTGPRPELGTLDRYDGDYRLTSPDQVVEGLDIYGRLIVTSTAIQAVMRNCIVRGPGSGYAGTSQISLVHHPSDFDFRELLIEDCIIDATGRENVYLDGINGGRYTMLRTEVAGVQDGVSLKTVVGEQTIEGCWIHNGAYFEWLPGTVNSPSQDNQTHSDAIQFHQGKNIVIRGNMIGGYRAHPTPVKPAPYDTLSAARVAAIRANDDYNNAGMMIQQEGSTEAFRKIENVVIDRNWIQGATAGMNISYKYGNDLSSVSITNNRFIRDPNPDHIYITKKDTTNPVMSGNVFDDNGALVPIRRG